MQQLPFGARILHKERRCAATGPEQPTPPLGGGVAANKGAHGALGRLRRGPPPGDARDEPRRRPGRVPLRTWARIAQRGATSRRDGPLLRRRSDPHPGLAPLEGSSDARRGLVSAGPECSCSGAQRWQPGAGSHERESADRAQLKTQHLQRRPARLHEGPDGRQTRGSPLLAPSTPLDPLTPQPSHRRRSTASLFAGQRILTRRQPGRRPSRPWESGRTHTRHWERTPAGRKAPRAGGTLRPGLHQQAACARRARHRREADAVGKYPQGRA